jgi:N,N'-diacetyllegionaminate synthase
MSSHTVIIAEAGVNHNGDLELAKRLIDAAADAGADWVKFQTFVAGRLATRTAVSAGYQLLHSTCEETQYEMLKRLELSADAHVELIEHSLLRKIGFFSTAFDLKSLELLRSLGQKLFKVPSGELTNYPYLRSIGRLRSSIILSTGMATLSDIEAAINVLEHEGTLRSDITVLHCTTAYPTQMVDVNLKAMQTIKAAFGVQVGYSDHTQGIEVPVAAVALGARVIEKHFTLSSDLPGPDHKASIEPAMLKLMVQSIRNIEQALGDGLKKPREAELSNRLAARKVIVANSQILAGEVFTEENLTTKRASNGVSPMRWNEVVGKTASRTYTPDESIDL